MPGHTPLILRTTPSPIERSALLGALGFFLRKGHGEALGSGDPPQGQMRYGSLLLGEVFVNVEITITDAQQVSVWFDSAVLDTMNYLNSSFGEPFNLEFEREFVKLCERIADTAQVEAFALTQENTLALAHLSGPCLGQTMEQVQVIMRGDFELTKTPPRLPLLAGLREGLVSMAEALDAWSEEEVYEVGSYLIWDSLRPNSETAEE